MTKYVSEQKFSVEVSADFILSTLSIVCFSLINFLYLYHNYMHDLCYIVYRSRKSHQQ